VPLLTVLGATASVGRADGAGIAARAGRRECTGAIAMPTRLDGTGWKMPALQMGVVAGTAGKVAGTTTGVVAGTPGTDAHAVGRYRVEDAHPTDLEGEAGRELTCERRGAKDCGEYRQAAGLLKRLC
jgi:hypothetical protein